METSDVIVSETGPCLEEAPAVLPSAVEMSHAESFQWLIKQMSQEYFRGQEIDINLFPGMRRDLLGLKYVSYDSLLQSEIFGDEIKEGCYVVRMRIVDGREFILHVGKSNIGVKAQAVKYLTNKMSEYSAKGIKGVKLSVALVKSPPDSLEVLHQSLKRRVPFTRYLLNGDVWRKNFKQVFWNWWRRERRNAHYDKEMLRKKLENQWMPIFFEKELGENLHGDMWGYGNMPGVYIIKSKDRVSGKEIIEYVGMSQYSMYKRVLKPFSVHKNKFGPNFFLELPYKDFSHALIPIPSDLVMKKWTYVDQIRWLETYIIQALDPKHNKQKSFERIGGADYNEYKKKLISILNKNNVRGSEYEILLDTVSRIAELTGIGSDYFLLNEIETNFSGYNQFTNRNRLLRLYSGIENLYHNISEEIFRKENPSLFGDDVYDDDDEHLKEWLLSQRSKSFQ